MCFSKQAISNGDEAALPWRRSRLGRGEENVLMDGTSPSEERAKIRVVIVEPQEVVREGLRLLLAANRDIEVVAAVASGEDAFAVTTSDLPDVVVTELTLPDARGLDKIRQLAALRPAPHVLVLSNFRLKDEVTAAFEAGARGCVSKLDGSGPLIQGIFAVQNGELFVAPMVRDLILRTYAGSSGGAVPEIRPGKNLTAREREVLRLISHGKTDRQTAELLNLSVKTVHTHRTNIMGKLGVHNVTMLIRRAIQLGIIEV
jgi:DNA-binding NarL/FixJ family response regulator